MARVGVPRRALVASNGRGRGATGGHVCHVGPDVGRRRACRRVPDVYAAGGPKGVAAPKNHFEPRAWGAI
jgi:hypothetical protein